jgi:tetrahydromethanopterin S-methyltransferase subunit B/uncharacterized protein YbjQ (UPF0145 family)
VNDLEQIPNTDAGGGSGGLSPRLEAELIAMLSRPSYAPSTSPYDQARASALQTMIGVVLGVLALGAVLWVNSLTAQIKDQGGRIDELGKAVRETTDMQRLAMDALLQRAEKAGEGPQSVSVLDGYKKALDARDRYKLEAENKSYINDQLASESKALRGDNFALKTRLDAAEALAKQNEADAKALKGLKEQVAKLEQQVDRQNGTIAAKAELLKAFDEDKGLALISNYGRAWWSSIIGWAVAVVALIGLAASWVYQNPVKEPGTDEVPFSGEANSITPANAPVPPPDAEPPHVIR